MDSVDFLREALQVARDEVRSQQGRIEALLAGERRASELVADLVRFLPLPVVTTDEAGLVVDVNPAAAWLFGASAPSLRGGPLAAHVVVADRPSIGPLLAPAPEGTERSARVRVVTADDAERPVEVSVTALRVGSSAQQLHWVLQDVARPEHPTSARSVVWNASTVASAVEALSQTSFAGLSTRDVLATLSGLAVEVLEGVDWASLTLGEPVRPSEAASESRYAQLADGVQWRNGAGPVQDAWDRDEVVGSADVHHDTRWPQQGWQGNPVRSVLALPVRVDGDRVGVLALYGAAPGGLGGTAAGPALVVSSVAGAALAGARRVADLRSTAEQMSQAMVSRAVIEQAKGLLAGATGCSPGRAFSALSTLSQARNVKLRDLAAELLSDPGRGVVLDELRAELSRGGSPGPAGGDEEDRGSTR